MKTAEQQFYEDWPNSPSGREWDKFEKQAQYFDAESVIDFAERFSDQQNKELREAMLNLQSECGYLQKFKDGVDAEIQRLTKEVEELKLKLSGKTFFNPFEQENTRLRELLRICKEELKEYSPDYLDDLFSNIDNALNHKP